MPRDSSRHVPDDSDYEQRRRSRARPHDDSDYEQRRHSRALDHERRRRRGHRATDSTGDLLARPSPRRDQADAAESPSPVKHSREHRQSRRQSTSRRDDHSGSTDASAGPLSLDALEKLNKQNNKGKWKEWQYDARYLEEVRAREEGLEKERVKEERRERREEREKDFQARRGIDSENETGRRFRRRESTSGKERPRELHTDDDRRRRRRHSRTEDEDRNAKGYDRREKSYAALERDERRRRRRSREAGYEKDEKTRVVSGPLLEKGTKERGFGYRGGGGGDDGSDGFDDPEARRKKKKRIIIAVIVIVVLLLIIIPAAVVASKKKKDDTPESNAASNSGTPKNSNLDKIDPNSIPASAKGTILDPFTWYDTEGFNLTYTDETVGGLPIMGLNSAWDDSVAPNGNVPPIEKDFEYGKMSIRGMNVGGWLNIEPFITPSFFEGFASRDGVRDEYTLTSKLGATRSLSTLEKHYSAFVRESTFADIRAAGFDHVRIPFGYWAVTTYPGDPYVGKVSWRYLLRGIEWARKYGLRINLDLHGAPGSQNGWNHSGRQGVIGWLNGTDGDVNAQRTLDIHDQLSKFFAQPRYKSIVTLYGIVNEPRMVDLNTQDVLDWTEKAINVIRGNGITAQLIFGDGFMGLDKWQGRLQNHDNLILDVHQYVIFNTDQLKLAHSDKLNFACQGWTQQSKRSMNKATGFGPTICGEWSQADTDCTQYINNVGIGSRWEGNLNTGNLSTSVLSPVCPTNNNPQCDCGPAIADPSTYSEPYKKWLLQFAQAQMESFEAGWGWFYWTWETERATQWSWRRGRLAGIVPMDVSKQRAFKCSDMIEDFAGLNLQEWY